MADAKGSKGVTGAYLEDRTLPFVEGGPPGTTG